MNNENIEEGISLGELFSIVWKRKIIISIITAGVTLLLVLVMLLFVNPSRSSYETTFELDFVGIDNNQYPSGKNFDYRNIISEQNIQMALDELKYTYLSAEDFEKDAITIKVDNDTDSNYQTYVISIKQNVFNNKEHADEFVSCIISQEYEKVLANFESLPFFTALNAAKESSTFDQQVLLLIQQYETIVINYEELLLNYGDQIVDGKNISLYLKEFEIQFNLSTLENLLLKLQEGYFVKNYTDNLAGLELTKTSLQIQKNNIANTISILKAQRDELLSSGSTNYPEIADYNTIIIEYTLQEIEIDKQLSSVDNKINNGDYTKMTTEQKEIYDLFVSEIENNQTKLQNYSETLKSVSTELFNEFTVVLIPDKDISNSTGSISLILIVVLGAMLGGGISSVSFIAIDLNKNKKNNKEEIA